MRRGLLACVLLAACTGDPDVVAHSLSRGVAADASDATTDAAPPGSAPGPTPGTSTTVVDAGADAAACNFDEALRNANLPPELLLVAVTCSVPLSWFTQGITGIDWLAILEVLLGGMTLPAGEGRAIDACDLRGVYYFPDPGNADNVKLCPSVCTALQNRVVASSGNVGCTRSMPPDDDAGSP